MIKIDFTQQKEEKAHNSTENPTDSAPKRFLFYRFGFYLVATLLLAVGAVIFTRAPNFASYEYFAHPVAIRNIAGIATLAIALLSLGIGASLRPEYEELAANSWRLRMRTKAIYRRRKARLTLPTGIATRDDALRLQILRHDFLETLQQIDDLERTIRQEMQKAPIDQRIQASGPLLTAFEECSLRAIETFNAKDHDLLPKRIS